MSEGLVGLCKNKGIEMCSAKLSCTKKRTVCVHYAVGNFLRWKVFIVWDLHLADLLGGQVVMPIAGFLLGHHTNKIF